MRCIRRFDARVGPLLVFIAVCTLFPGTTTSGVCDTPEGAYCSACRSVCSGGTSDRRACERDTQCPGGTCGACDGGANPGAPCFRDVDCPGDANQFIPAGVCDPVCVGGDSDGQVCDPHLDCAGGSCLPSTCFSDNVPPIEIASIELSALKGRDGFVVDVTHVDNPSFSAGVVAVATGNFNGDFHNGRPVDDLILGIPRASRIGLGGIRGKVFVVFGLRGQSFPARLDLSTLTPDQALVINGLEDDDEFGIAVAAADFNGDGKDDVLVGAPGARLGRGRAYLIYGSDQAVAANVLTGGSGSDEFTVFEGAAIGDRFGQDVAAAGRFDGDDRDDIIVAARRILTPPRVGFALSTVIFGGNWPGPYDRFDLIGSTTAPGITPHTAVSSAGDVNGDGVDDVIVGSHDASTTGQSYVVFGSTARRLADLTLASLDGSNGFTIYGAVPGERSGYAVSSAGNLNGDQSPSGHPLDDLLIGAPSYQGRTNVVYGRETFPAGIELDNLGDGGFSMQGIRAFDSAGNSVAAAGDVNGDGLHDIVIGAPGADPLLRNYAGQTYVIFGSSSPGPPGGQLDRLDGTTGYAINGKTESFFEGSVGPFFTQELSGSRLAAGDVNGDGFDDVVIGTFGANLAYVVLGRDEVHVPPRYRFVALGDTRGQGTYLNTAAVQAVFRSIRDCLDPQPEFVVFGGDMVGGTSTLSTMRFQLLEWIKTIDGVMGQHYTNHRVYPVFGGHERTTDQGDNGQWKGFDLAFFKGLCSGGSRDKQECCPGGTCRETCTGSTCESRCVGGSRDNSLCCSQGVCLNDRRSLARTHLTTDLLGSSVYSFDYANARFFVLNNDLPDHRLDTAQLDWIKAPGRFINNGKDLNFFFHHEPAFATLAHCTKDDATCDTCCADPLRPGCAGCSVTACSDCFVAVEGMDVSEDDRDAWIQLLGCNGATLVFSGHEHHYTHRLITPDLLQPEYRPCVPGPATYSFSEIKTGSAGAGWYGMGPNRKQLLAAREDASENPPYHYAVLDVYKNKVTLRVNGIHLNGSQDDTCVSLDEYAFSSTLKPAEPFDQNAQGQQDAASFMTATAAGQILITLPAASAAKIAIGGVQTFLDSSSWLDQRSKPDRDFLSGIVGANISGLQRGETITIELTYPEDVPRGYEYYSAGIDRIAPFVFEGSGEAAITTTEPDDLGNAGLKGGFEIPLLPTAWHPLPIGSNDGDASILLTLTDGGSGDVGGTVDGVITMLGGLTAPKPTRVNDLVTFRSIGRSRFEPDGKLCEPAEEFDLGYPPGFIGTLSFTMRLTNRSRSVLSEITTPVRVLTGGNVVQNAAVGPAGVGAVLTVPRRGSYGDGRLGIEESVDVDYVICVRNNQRYTFQVDIEARVE